MIEQVNQRDLRVAQFDAATFSLTIDYLQLRDPVNPVAETHWITAVLLDDFAPESHCVHLVGGNVAVVDEEFRAFAEILLNLESGHVATTEESHRLLAPKVIRDVAQRVDG